MNTLLNEEREVNVGTGVPTLMFADVFLGHVDLIKKKSIAGWVTYKENPEQDVKVGLWMGSRCLIEQLADVYRPDLVPIRSDGRCGYELAIPPMFALVASKSRQPIRLIVNTGTVQSVLIENIFMESAEKASDAALARTREAFWLAHILLQTADDEEKEIESEAQINTSIASTPGEFVGRIHAAVQDNNYTPQKASTAKAEFPELSHYIHYTIKRLKLDSQFNIDEYQWECSDALLWYIEGYGSSRKPLRIPLSKNEISYCNTMLDFPGCRFSISRAHYFYLLKNRPGFAPAKMLNSDSEYRDELYNWVSETTNEMNVSDVLIPTDYVDYIKKQSPHWKGRRFALNGYFEIRRQREKNLAAFSVDCALERGLMYLVVWLESGGKPEFTQFMPEKVWKELFEISNHDSMTFFEEIAMEVLENVSIGDVRVLYESVVNTHRMLLKESGFDIDREKYHTCDQHGNRRHQPSKVALGNEGPCELQVIGPFGSASGLGQATRLSVLAMRSAGLQPHLVNFDLDNPSPIGFSTLLESGTPKQSRVNLIHLNAEAAPLAAAYLPDIFSDSYNIGYFFWELDTPAECHSLALEMFDEIWVSTEFGVRQYSGSFRNPVINVGMTFEELETPSKIVCRERLNEQYGITTDETIFLTTFDSYSFVQRKNPKAVIGSFLEAFPRGDERVRLIIKTQNRELVLDPNQQKIWKSIDYLIALDSRIMLINETINYSDLLCLKKAADCYVSLHRSEGWGFGMVEAMMLEVSVIATGYSGNLEYCNSDNCWLVEIDEIYLNHNDYIFVEPGQKWSDPRVSDAARCMKEAHECENVRIKKAHTAHEYIHEEFSPSSIGQRYAERLKYIAATLESKSIVSEAV